MKEIYEKKLREIIANAKQAHKHPAKLMVLSELLRDIFRVEIEEILPGVETDLKSEIYGLRGSADLLYSSVIFEIKSNLKREFEDAKAKLKKYFQSLLEKEPNEKHIGIATDVINFKAYLPKISNGKVVELIETSELNIETAPPSKAILWLDSHIFSQPMIRPTAIDLKYRFGTGSPTYSIVIDELNKLWNEVKDRKEIKLKFDLWSKSMEIVYGSKPSVQAFIDQTYLVTLVKLIVYLRLSGENTIDKEKIKKSLNGEYFISYGIINLIEEDFFTWILHPVIEDKALSIFYKLSKELQLYDFKQINEDFFKEIYQDIIERGQRHRIGEYYTPEWLTELTLKEVINLWKKGNKHFPRILDPACGSGTFLTNAIKIAYNELKKERRDPVEILNWLVANIVGLDINPLAVVIARANYILALGDLLKIGQQIIIPVYVADSIHLPTIKHVMERIKVFDIEIKENNKEKYHLQIPSTIANDGKKINHVVNLFKSACKYYKEKGDKKASVKVFEKNASRYSKEEIEVLKNTLEVLFFLIDQKMNSIWLFWINNFYAPIPITRKKCDVLVGNPPWIAMRYIENAEYQDFLKTQVLNYDLLERDQIHLFTHMEMATTFFSKCSDIYLQNEGLIAFVLPRSVLTGAFHHAKFKQFRKPPMKLLKIFDMEDVYPLFNVPSCVLVAQKNEETTYPISARRFKGKLPDKNIGYEIAQKHLRIKDYPYEPPVIIGKYSLYHSKVKQGATIVPRTFWFIEFISHPTLGIDINKPIVRSSRKFLAISKKPWKFSLTGNVESEFMYATILGGDIVPFGYSNINPIIIPSDPGAIRYSLLDVDPLRNRGYIQMAEWLGKAQQYWEKLATTRTLKSCPRVINWIDYRRKLTSQNPKLRYVVLYNTSGTNLVSCVVDKKSLGVFPVLNTSIKPRGFIAESTTYFYETNNKDEAHYLCAILNSEIVNTLIKPLQPRGLFGERHFHRRPFMLPIPNFDENNALHDKLSKISKKAHKKVKGTKYRSKGTATKRREAKVKVREEIREIDKIVIKLFGGK